MAGDQDGGHTLTARASAGAGHTLTARAPAGPGRPRIAPDAEQQHRRRMRLILWIPAVKAHSTLRFAAWQQVVAEFAAERLGQPPGALGPQAIAHAVLGVAVAAYEQWLPDEGADLGELL